MSDASLIVGLGHNTKNLREIDIVQTAEVYGLNADERELKKIDWESYKISDMFNRITNENRFGIQVGNVQINGDSQLAKAFIVPVKQVIRYDSVDEAIRDGEQYNKVFRCLSDNYGVTVKDYGTKLIVKMYYCEHYTEAERFYYSVNGEKSWEPVYYNNWDAIKKLTYTKLKYDKCAKIYPAYLDASSMKANIQLA